MREKSDDVKMVTRGYLTHGDIKPYKTTLAKNLRVMGQRDVGDLIDQLADECIRLRQGLWDVAKACGADTDGNDTPAP